LITQQQDAQRTEIGVVGIFEKRQTNTEAQ